MAQTPAQIANKWANNLSNSISYIEAGIDGVTENPAQKAIARKDKMRANLLAAIDGGKWERGLQSVTLNGWKAAFKTKGLPRIASGAQAAKPKVQAFQEALQPYQQAGKAQLDAMPDLTLQDSINRVAFWINYMADFEG